MELHCFTMRSIQFVPSGSEGQRFLTSSQPGQLFSLTIAPDNPQKNLFERKLFSGRASAIAGFHMWLRFDPSAQLFKRSLGDQPSLMNDGEVAAQALHDFEHM